MYLYFDFFKSSKDWQWIKKFRNHIQEDELRKIERTKNRLIRNAKCNKMLVKKFPM